MGMRLLQNEVRDRGTLATYIETPEPEKAGRFYSYNGQEVPW